LLLLQQKEKGEGVKDMIILRENETSKKNEGVDDWLPISTKQLFASIGKNSRGRKVDVFVVGPDHYLIEDGKFAGTTTDRIAFIDKDGVIVEFLSSSISNIRDLQGFGCTFSFFVGRKEIQLIIN
jgi:hypothetical protein